MSTALFEFMPYGAPELIDGARQRIFRATATSMAMWALLFIALVGALIARPKEVEVRTTVVVPYRELAAPPPLDDVAPPPQIVFQAPAAAPTVGVPVPVPDAQVPEEQTIASQEEIAAATGSVDMGTGDQQIVVQPPAPEEMPALGEFVYTDELPVLITDVPPRYPELAREAGLEGEVMLRILIAKNGRVAEVHIDRSVPLLDDAAVEAARKWVFKPALANNRPIAVWIVRVVRFTLSTIRS